MSRTLTPLNFAKAWKRPLRKIEFSQWPVLPAETTSFFHYAGLPETFVCGRASFRFVATPRRLSDTWSHAMDARWAFPFLWHRYWHIGDFELSNASSWICLEEVTGSIVKVDVELDQPVNRVNSSVLLFATCMKIIVDWHDETAGDLKSMPGLIERLTAEVPSDDAALEWIPLVESEREGPEPLRVAVA